MYWEKMQVEIHASGGPAEIDPETCRVKNLQEQLVGEPGKPGGFRRIEGSM
jgi:hypothetical protein